jgi:protease-4
MNSTNRNRTPHTSQRTQVRASALALVRSLVLAMTLGTLAACNPTIRVDLLPGPEPLAPVVVLEKDSSESHRVAMIELRGLLVDSVRPTLLGGGENPVDRFIAQLTLAEEDPRVKAVIVRISSPGGTVTSSHILYTELRAFRERSGKPVVVSIGEVAASGGYYVALAADQIIAEPTSITGSIGVIVQTVNVSKGLSMIGITSRSVVSGQNKDLANPLGAVEERHFAVLQELVDGSYARFRGLVVERRPALAATDLDMATDGRIFSGEAAHKLGLIDGLGGVRDAHAAAKSLAGIKAAQLVRYVTGGEVARTPYAASPTSAPGAEREINLLQLNLAGNAHLGGLGNPMETSGIYYLWMP